MIMRDPQSPHSSQCLTRGLAQPGVRVFPHLLTRELPEATRGGQVGWGMERGDQAHLAGHRWPLQEQLRRQEEAQAD